jgi:hypothetical protein
MTAEPLVDAEEGEDATLHCYRHPDRETYVRCGRCDRPICLRCTVEGPVGFRCHDCGKAVGESLGSFASRQLAGGSTLWRGVGAIIAVLSLARLLREIGWLFRRRLWLPRATHLFHVTGFFGWRAPGRLCSHASS